MPLDPGGGQRAVDLVACAPVGVEVDERLAGQLGEFDGVPGGEGTVRCAGQHERLTGQGGHPQVVRHPVLTGDEREVETARAHLLDQFGVAGLAHPDLHTGVQLVEPRQHRGQVHHVQALQAADGQRAAQQPLDGGDRVPGRLDAAQRPARLGQQRPSGLGQLDLAGGAQEQRRAQLDLQCADRRRETRLGDAQPVRGSGEMALLGDREEVFELPEFHDSSPAVLNEISSLRWTA
ncbi:hypothetical protein DFR72_105220 [Lentzea flaviverrucosa]|uniref:Uncharacterized protein n=1 Tax=Lentzea flaviverrucosa TaxID=200379 RepID=A0A1H9PLB5_9PSEU|nr:hypothetical protein DFR72_105220 [Lentzea flaviverrucosa]SER49106.1 hypothetical protein SAMN05216195_105352 [Lentzea flaviverrucosa]